MTFPNGSSGVRTPNRSDQLPPHGPNDAGSPGDFPNDIHQDVGSQHVGPEMSARGPMILVVLVGVVALVLAALLYLAVLGTGTSEQTTSEAAPAAPLGSLEGSGADADQSGPDTFGAGSPGDGSIAGNEAVDSTEGETPSALVVTSDDLAESDDPADAGSTADQSTTVAPTSVAPTTVAQTQPPTTEATTTQPPPTEAPTTQPAATQPPTTTASTAAPTTAPPPPPSGADGAVQQEVLNLTNAERAANGCGPVVLDPTLNAVADAHSEDMAANNYFDHTGLNGSQPWDRVRAAGYPAGGSGENIAQGYSTAQSVVNGWMNSSGHRRNILNCSWTELGVGYANGSSSQGNIPPIYWTQVFATRR